MNDMEILVAMLKNANAKFEVCDSDITIYGEQGDIIIFYFDKSGNILKVD